MILSLDYSDLSATITQANKLSNELGQYCDDLSKKVQKKMYSVDGGMSSALNNADYYVNAKIKQLRTKENNAKTLSTRVQTLLNTAKRVDSSVEQMIQNRQKELFKKNPDLKAPWYERAFVSFMCDLKNIPALGLLVEAREHIRGALDTLLDDIRYWYKCEGGKETIGIILSWTEAILAGIIFICAFSISGGTIFAIIAGIAGIISATIGLVNAATNIVTSQQAYEAAMGGHPGMAKIYANQDTFADYLRETNFHDKTLNRNSNIAASAIEITDAVCSIVKAAYDVGKIFKDFKNTTIFKEFNEKGKTAGFRQLKSTFHEGIQSVKTSYSGKGLTFIRDLVLGDLKVNNLSVIIGMDHKGVLKTIGTTAKAASGLVSDIDKLNEGKITFTELLAKRFVTGMDAILFKQQELSLGFDKNDLAFLQYEDTEMTKLINMPRTIIDSIGAGKILTNGIGAINIPILGELNLTNVFKPKGGIIESAGNISAANGSWDSKSFGNAISINQISIPTVPTLTMTELKGFMLPKFNFKLNLSFTHPYYDVAA